MKTFIITTVLNVADSCESRKADITMVRRYVNDIARSRIIKRDCFREKVVLDVKKVTSEVFEVFP